MNADASDCLVSLDKMTRLEEMDRNEGGRAVHLGIFSPSPLAGSHRAPQSGVSSPGLARSQRPAGSCWRCRPHGFPASTRIDIGSLVGGTSRGGFSSIGTGAEGRMGAVKISSVSTKQRAHCSTSWFGFVEEAAVDPWVWVRLGRPRREDWNFFWTPDTSCSAAGRPAHQHRLGKPHAAWPIAAGKSRKHV